MVWYLLGEVSMSITISVRAVGEGVVSMDVQPEISMAEFFEFISLKTGAEVDRLQLIFGGQRLPKDETPFAEFDKEYKFSTASCVPLVDINKGQLALLRNCEINRDALTELRAEHVAGPRM